MTLRDRDRPDAPGDLKGRVAGEGLISGQGRRWASWSSWKKQHLFDYPPRATALWLVIVGSGAAALLWAVLQCLRAPAVEVAQVAIAVGLSAVASRYALKLPGSGMGISAADIFIFGALLHVGPVAAVLAAGIEGWMAPRRTSKRLSSWLGSSAAAMAAMSGCAWLYGLTQRALAEAGLPDSAAA
jgi:hypothetical protein